MAAIASMPCTTSCMVNQTTIEREYNSKNGFGMFWSFAKKSLKNLSVSTVARNLCTPVGVYFWRKHNPLQVCSPQVGQGAAFAHPKHMFQPLGMGVFDLNAH